MSDAYRSVCFCVFVNIRGDAIYRVGGCMSEQKLNENIVIVEQERKKHSKASEEYVHVKFKYNDDTWDGWVPVEYRRTGVSIKPTDTDELTAYLNAIYEQMNPLNYRTWLQEQARFWQTEKTNAKTTKSFFDCLSEGGWKCVECSLPKNPNWARRIQDLKEFGYTIATDTKRYCPICAGNKTHLILLPIERLGQKGNGYETLSSSLRKRIIMTLNSLDVFECKTSTHCLPDHKFPEIRWDENTKSENPDTMTNDQIKSKFQLLTNQRNQEKREACRKCFQTGKRGCIYGISFYYKGTEFWDQSIPSKGKAAEKGCVGCPWYDIAEWRKAILELLKIATSVSNEGEKEPSLPTNKKNTEGH